MSDSRKEEIERAIEKIRDCDNFAVVVEKDEEIYIGGIADSVGEILQLLREGDKFLDKHLHNGLSEN